MATQPLVESFDQEGYLVLDRIIQGQRLARFTRMCDELVARAPVMPADAHWIFDAPVNGAPPQLYKVDGVGLIEPRFLDLVRDHAIVQQVECLLGPNIEAIGTRFFPAFPRVRPAAPWHQDRAFLEVDSDRLVSALVYLQDSCREKGCLKVIPRSHINGTYEHHHPAGGAPRVEVDERSARALEFSAGSVVLLSPRLLYATTENRSRSSRYIAAWHYVPSDLELAQYPKGFFRDRYYVQGI